MSLPTNRNAKADQSSLEPTPPYTSNVTMAPIHNLSGRDSVRLPDETESSLLMDTLGVAETSEVATRSSNYIYYRIYAEDGAIPSKTPVAPGDPFLGRIKARSVPPPRTVKAVKHNIAKVENIKDRESTSLFSTPYSQSPMGDADKVTIGSTPQEPLALVAKMSDSERSAFESEGRGGLASAAELETVTTPSDIRYVYYLLYAGDYEIPSKVAIDPKEPSLGRIRADSVAPPHSPTSIKRCISRVERTPALAHADLFANTSCDTPLIEGHISILRTGLGLSPNEPMAIVQVERPLPVSIVQVESPLPVASIPDGKYVIKNREADLYWFAWSGVDITVYFWPMGKDDLNTQWDITHDTITNGNISIRSLYAPSSWVGADSAEITGSKVPIPWRLIPADGKFYYLTTEMNRDSQNPQVPGALAHGGNFSAPGSMSTLKEGDRWQMWEFIRI